MKTNILSYITLGALMLGSLSACEESFKPTNERNGQVDLSSLGIKVDSTVAQKTSRASEDGRAEYNLDDYIVRIYDSSDAMVANWRYAEMPEIFTLPVGQNYRVDVVSHNVEKSAWEAPLFTGSRTFDIEDSKITDVGTVTCKFASLKVTVEFSAELKKAMSPETQVRVVANDLGELVYTADEVRAGYFEVVSGSNTLAYDFEGPVNGSQEKFHGVYTDVVAGQHRIIKFSLKQNSTDPDVETGTVMPGSGIQVNMDVENDDISGEFSNQEDPTHPNRPDEEDWQDPNPGPGPDDPNPPVEEAGKIEFTSALRFGVEMNPAQESDGVVNIYVEKGIEKLEVTIDTDSDTFAETLESVGVPTYFDMAHPKDSDADVLALVNPNNDPILGETDVKFDITQFLSLLMFDGTHKFIIKVTDADGNSDSRTIIFKVG